MCISVSLTTDKLRRKGRMNILRLVLIFGMSLYGVPKSEIVHNRNKSNVIRRLAWPEGHFVRPSRRRKTEWTKAALAMISSTQEIRDRCVIDQETEDDNPEVHVANDDSYRCHHVWTNDILYAHVSYMY